MDGRERRRNWLDRLMEVAGLLGNVFVASLAWSALAVLILPLPAASAALFHTTGLVAADRAGNPFADFLTGLREHWRRATAIGGPVMLLGLVLGVDALYFLGQPTVALKAVGCLFASAFLLWAAVMLMFWPLLVTRGGDWRRLLRESFWLTMATLPWRLVAVAVAAVASVAALLYPFLIPLAPGLVAFVASWLVRRTLRRFQLVEGVAA